MPCSDNEARSYLDDWRTQQFIKDEKKLNSEIKKLEKELNKSKTQAQKELEDQIKKLNQDNINLAKRLNKTTELLCGATFKMFTYDQENHEKYLKGLWDKNDLEKPDPILKHGTKLHQWFLEHTEDDANRMKEELDKIRNHKGRTLQSIIKWYNGLDDKEKWVFETHKNFKGIKLHTYNKH